MSDTQQPIIVAVEATAIIVTPQKPAEAIMPAFTHTAKPVKTSVLSMLPVVLSDLKRFSWLFMFSLTALASFHITRMRFFEPRDYFAYQNTVGPFSYIEGKDGKAESGSPIVSIPPGGTFTWIVSFCLNSGISVKGNFQFVRLKQNGLSEIVVVNRDAHLTPESRRCGPLVNKQLVPEDALPGTYELRRVITMREGGWFPFTQEFEPVRIVVIVTPKPEKVEQPAQPVQPSVGEPPMLNWRESAYRQSIELRIP